MGLSISAGRILITDGSTTRFDTNDDYFHILTRLSGTRSFPARSVTATYNDERDRIALTNSYNLGSVAASCTAVFGNIKLDYGASSPDGLSENAWFSISGGGTYIHIWDTFAAGKPSPFRRGGAPEQIVTYSFTLSGSGSERRVILTERVRLLIDDVQPNPGDFTTFATKAFTMQYRLRAGTFT